MNRTSIAGFIGFGLIALASTAATTAAAPVPAADAARGKIVFARCAVCHKIDRAVPGGIGPNLADVHGRVAGRLPGYSYSAAMKASGIRWTDADLARFVAAPAKVVPGTKMMAPPVADAQDRANLIAYLKSAGGATK